MPKAAQIGAVLLLISACSPTSGAGVDQMLRAGQLRVDPAPPGASYDYVVKFPILRDFGFSTERRADRVGLVQAALQKECANVSIVREGAIESGQLLTGPDRQFTEYVRCDRG